MFFWDEFENKFMLLYIFVVANWSKQTEIKHWTKTKEKQTQFTWPMSFEANGKQIKSMCLVLLMYVNCFEKCCMKQKAWTIRHEISFIFYMCTLESFFQFSIRFAFHSFVILIFTKSNTHNMFNIHRHSIHLKTR